MLEGQATQILEAQERGIVRPLRADFGMIESNRLCKLLRRVADEKRKENLNLTLYHKLGSSGLPTTVWPSRYAWKADELTEKHPS